MDKEKVINNLLDIRKLTGGADNPASEGMVNQDLFNIREIADNVNHPITEDEKDKCMQTIVDIAGKTIKELNFKPEMPVVFDDWFKLLNKPTQGEALSILYWIVFDIDVRTHEQQNLFDWIKGDNSEFIFMRRISKCIDAIKYGYEVEK